MQKEILAVETLQMTKRNISKVKMSRVTKSTMVDSQIDRRPHRNFVDAGDLALFHIGSWGRLGAWGTAKGAKKLKFTEKTTTWPSPAQRPRGISIAMEKRPNDQNGIGPIQ